MKIAVTGATGFIGRHVLDVLARRLGVTVVTGSRHAEPGSHGFQHVQLDIGDASAAQAYERLGRPDVLLHLAWSGLPNYRSLHHLEVELGHQFRFLAGMVRAGLPKLVATGTCFEYGMLSGELDECTLPQPGNPYGLAKDVLRRELEFLAREKRFGFTWARLFYMYGEGQAPTSLYSLLAAAVRDGKPSFPMSGGEQIRDFLPVTDVAANLVQLALDCAPLGVVNVCSGRPVSVRRQVDEWLASWNAHIELQLGVYPYPDYEPLAFWGSNARLRAALASGAPSA